MTGNNLFESDLFCYPVMLLTREQGSQSIGPCSESESDSTTAAMCSASSHCRPKLDIDDCEIYCYPPWKVLRRLVIFANIIGSVVGNPSSQFYTFCNLFERQRLGSETKGSNVFESDLFPPSDDFSATRKGPDCWSLAKYADTRCMRVRRKHAGTKKGA